MQKLLYLYLVFVCCNLRVIAQVDRVRDDGSEGFIRLEMFEEKVDLRQLDQLPHSYEIYASLGLNQSSFERFLAQPVDRYALVIPGKKEFTLQLERVDFVAPGATLITADRDHQPLDLGDMHFYQGRIKDVAHSSVSLSIIEQQITALISHPELGDLQVATFGKSDTYLVYQTKDWADKIGVFCDTPDEPTRYLPEQLINSTTLRSTDIPLTLYLEIDYDIFLHYGDVNATKAFALTLFNQLRGLYSGEHINVLLADLFIWNAPSPYHGSSSYEMLSKFQEVRQAFNGDIGQLISYKASGGLAASFAGLCNPDRSQSLSFSHIEPPVYSSEGLNEATIVIAHEIGHLLGSRHTHACVWNGNNTAIDGCAGYVEGTCGLPPSPKNGGTVMSYCHLQDQGSQIYNGYGQQPGNVLRFELYNRPCTPARNSLVFFDGAALIVDLNFPTHSYYLHQEEYIPVIKNAHQYR
ncbi:MAG: M12 family metallo-peptidase [Bacteroidota bacterium]